jgi:hypothetical protein
MSVSESVRSEFSNNFNGCKIAFTNIINSE